MCVVCVCRVCVCVCVCVVCVCVSCVCVCPLCAVCVWGVSVFHTMYVHIYFCVCLPLHILVHTVDPAVVEMTLAHSPNWSPTCMSKR